MSNVDERVVVLSFDNSNFEKNTQQSIKTLNELDSSIKKSSSGEGLKNLGKSANKIDLSNLSRSIDTVNSRFSTLGIVGMSAIANITNSIVNMGKKLVTAIPTQIIQGGWKRALNIEQAKFQIEGLNGVWDETSANFKSGVTTMKEAVNAAVDSTAYGLDEAAKIASQLMASGLTDTDEMTNALKGIAGVSAMTSSEYSDIGRIFAQVAGQGRLMGDQLLQLSQRGINVAATLADQFGVSEAEIREATTKGQISFEMFYKAMNAAFGDHAKKANETFTGSLANMKAALSRIGAEAASPALTNLRNLFNALTPLINNIHTALIPVINAMNKISEITSNLIVKGINNLTNILAPASAATNKTSSAFSKLASTAKKTSESVSKDTKKATGVLTISKKEAQAAWDIWNKGTYGNGEARKKNLKAVGLSYHNVQSYINALVKADFDMNKVQIKVGKRRVQTLEKVAKAGTTANEKIAKSSEDANDATKKQVKTLNPLVAILKTIGNVVRTIKNVVVSFINILRIGVNFIKAIFTPILVNSTNGIYNVTTKIADMSEKLKNFTNKIAMSASKVISNKLAPAFAAVYSKITGFIGKMKEAIVTSPVFQRFIAALATALKGIANTFIAVGKAIGSFFVQLHNSKGMVELREQLGLVWEALKKLAGGLFEKFVSQFEKFTGSVSKVSVLDKVVGFFSKIAGWVAKLIKQIREGTSPIQKFFGLISSATKNGNSFSIIETAKGGTGDEVSNTTDKITTFTGIIKHFFAVIKEGYSATVDKIKDVFGNGKLGEFFRNLGDSLANIDTDQLLKRAWDVVKIFAVIKLVKDNGKFVNAAVGTMDGLKGLFSSLSDLTKAAKHGIQIRNFQAMAIAIGILAASMWVLAKIPTDKAIQAVAMVGTIFGMLIGVMVLSEKLKIKRMQALGIALAGMGAGMLMLSIAATRLAAMNGGDIVKAGIAITAFMGIFITASKLTGSVAKAGASFLAMAFAINVLIPAIIIMSKLKLETLVKGGTAIFSFMVLMGLASKVAASDMKTAAGFLAMAGAVAILVPSIMAISLLPFAKAMKGAVVVSAIMIAMAAAAKISDKSSGSLLKISAAMVLLSGSLVVLSLLPTNKLLTVSGSLIGLMVSLAAAGKIAEKADKSILIMIGVIAALATIITIMCKLNKGSEVLSICAGLSTLGISLGITIGIFSKIGAGAIEGALFAIAGISIFAAGMTALLVVLGGISKIKGVKELMNGGVEMFALIGKAIGSFIGNIVGGVMSGISKNLVDVGTNLSDFMTEMKPFFALLGEMDEDTTSKVKALGSTLKGFVDALRVSNIDGFNMDLSGFVKSMMDFLPKYMEFAKMAASIPEDNLEAGLKVAKAVKSIADVQDEIPDQQSLIGKALTGDDTLSGVTRGLINFIGFYKVLAKASKDITEEDLTATDNLKKAAKKIGDIANIDIPDQQADWTKDITGDDSLGGVAKGLKSFVDEFLKLSKKAADITDDDLTAAENVKKAAKTIGKIANIELPDQQSGLGMFLTGDDSLVGVMTRLIPFVNMFKTFANTALTITEDEILATDRVKTGAIAIGKIANIKLPDQQSGIGAFLTGDDSLSGVMRKLMPFIGMFKSFAKTAGTITDDQITAANKVVSAAKKIGSLAKYMNSVKGIGFTFNTKLISFTNSMLKFIPTFKKFATAAGGISDSDLNAAKKVADSAKSLAQAGKISAGLAATSAGPLTTLASQAKTYATTVNNLQVDAIKKNTAAITSSISTISKSMKKTSSFKSAGSSAVAAYAKGLSEGSSKVSSAARKISSAVATSIKSSAKFKTAGSSSATSFANGLTSSGKPKTAGTSIGKKASNAAKDTKDKFRSAGVACAQGFANGLSDPSTLQTVASKGTSLGDLAYKKAKKALESNSPSKKFRQLGIWSCQGFVIGMEMLKKKVGKTAESMGETAIEGTQSSLDGFGEMQDPVIRPVIDLSNVQKGASDMANMLDANQSTINAQYNAKAIAGQNGSEEQQNRAVATKIDKLVKVIENNMGSDNTEPKYSFGDITLDVSSLDDVMTLDNFVSVLKRAKSFK